MINNSTVQQMEDNILNKLNIAKDWGTFLYKKAVHSSEEAVKNLSERIKFEEIKLTLHNVPILREFQQAQSEFQTETQKTENKIDSSPYNYSDCGQSNLPPWHPDLTGLNDPLIISGLRDRILGLSRNPNNFLISPPDEANFQWNKSIPNHLLNEAQILLKEDPNLSSIRYKLVPSKISEDLFWRNYFYRLSLIKQSAHLSAMTDRSDENNSSESDFICVEQSSLWPHQKLVNENAVDCVPPTKDVQQSQYNLSKQSTNADHHPNISLSTSSNESVSSQLSCKSKESINLTDLYSVPSSLQTSDDDNNNQNENKKQIKTLEEEIEEEIAREVDELVVAGNDDEMPVELIDVDSDLESELMAQLENVNNDK